MRSQKLMRKYLTLLCVSFLVALCVNAHAAPGVRELGARYNTQQVDSVAFSPNGHTLADSVRYIYPLGPGAKELGAVRLWNVRTGTRVGALRTYAIARSLVFSPDGRMLATALELGRGRKVRGMVKVWNLKTSKVIAQLDIPQGHAEAVAWTPNGKLIAAGCGDSRVLLWNWKSNKVIRVLQGSGNSITSLAMAPNGRFLAGGSLYAENKSTRLWEISTGRALYTWKDQGQVAFSPDSRLVATSSAEERKYVGADALVRVWTVSNGKLRYTFPSQNGSSAESLAFAPKGLVLAIVGSNPTMLWDLRKNKVVQTLPSPRTDGQIAFSPDGKLLAQAGAYSTSYLFNVKAP